jgi:hypothetical protein
VGFEVSPEPVRRGRWSTSRIVAVVLVAATVVGIGLMTSRGSQRSDQVARVSASAPAPGSVTASSPVTLAGPERQGDQSGLGTVACNDVDTFRCSLILAATMKRLRPETDRVDGIGVWTSLLCHDASDCPPSRFVGFRPLGSAFVTLGPGRTAWLNVVEPTPHPGREPLAGGAVAWVIRWSDATP